MRGTSRRAHRAKLAAALVGVAMLGGLWVTFAPAALGGSVTYSITDGVSMQPLLHENDLALVRPAATYDVGDVVLYDSPVLHRPVLHRIVVIQDGNYFFKGDNNSFVDPGYATRTELVGRLWFHVAEAGAVLGWFGKPLHAALLAGAAVLVVALTGAGTTVRRRRRRRSRAVARRGVAPKVGGAEKDEREGTPTMDPSAGERRVARPPTSPGSRAPARERRSGIPMSRDQLATRRPPSFLEGSTTMLVLTSTCFVLAAILAGVGFARPSQQTTALVGAYEQSGTFAYSASTKAPTSVYPSGAVTTGEPIYASLVNLVQLHFSYRFRSALPHDVKGTVKLDALLLSQTNTWQQLSTLVVPTSFRGDRATVTSSVPLSSLYSLINSVSTQSGVAGVNYSADIQPVVHLTGTVGGEPVDTTFSPVLPFTVTDTTITLNAAVAPAPPGATYVASSAGAALSATVHPTQAGSIPHLVANDVSLARYALPVPALRVLAYVFAALALAFGVLHDVLRRRKTMRSDEELIARRLDSMIVPVASLSEPGGDVDVGDFTHLAGLAHFLEQPILYELRDGRRTYAVDDDAHRYVYRPAPSGPAGTVRSPRDRRARTEPE